MNTLAHPAEPLPASRAPAAVPPRPAARPFKRRLQRALFRWWLRLCRQAERKTRFVPRY